MSITGQNKNISKIIQQFDEDEITTEQRYVLEWIAENFPAHKELLSQIAERFEFTLDFSTCEEIEKRFYEAGLITPTAHRNTILSL